MDYENLNLREKTFLDFTNDEKIIEIILGDNSRESVNYFLSNITEYERVHTLIDFADYTPDKQLAEAIRREFKEEIDALFDE